MNIPTFDKFNTKVNEELTTAEKLQKNRELNTKLDELKKELQEALNKKENDKANKLQIKIQIAELDIKKFELQSKLEKLN